MKNEPIAGDSLPLSFQKHPRNTVLGASLQLEALLPYLSKEKINELSPILAREFEDMRRRAKLEAVEDMEKMVNQRSDASALGQYRYAEAYDKAISDVLSRLAAYRGSLTK
mgnify:CR=1 FL=1